LYPAQELIDGATLPQFVKAEFDAFLKFGIFTHEFLTASRLRRPMVAAVAADLQNSQVLKVCP